MRFEYKHIKDAGSCSFCKRGILAEDNVKFPYNHVYVINGDGEMVVRICRECVRELKENL